MQNFLAIDNVPKKTIRNFFNKVEIDSETGCWLWTATTTQGYGKFYFMGEMHYAHRFTYAWLIEPLPKGISKKTLQLDHVVCDTRHCVNPWHVKTVLPRENILRGNSVQAINSRKTHCPKGHPYDRTRSNRNDRYCSICKRTNQYRWEKQKLCR